MIIQMCGMSGAGKSTLAKAVKLKLSSYKIEVVDGDVYRQTLCKDLGFSKEDRMENIRRLGAVASTFSQQGSIVLISAINPYEQVRKELRIRYANVYTVYIKCDLDELIKRDTKGLYKKALLPDNDPLKIRNLSGVNDPFEIPDNADLIVDTEANDLQFCVLQISNFILETKKVFD